MKDKEVDKENGVKIPYQIRGFDDQMDWQRGRAEEQT